MCGNFLRCAFFLRINYTQNISYICEIYTPTMQRIQRLRRIFVILSMMCRADTSVVYVSICHRVVVRLNGSTNDNFRSVSIRKESVRLYFSLHFFKLLGVKYSGGLKDLIFLDCVGIRPERARTRFAFRTSLFSFPIHSPPLASGKTKQVCPLCRSDETKTLFHVLFYVLF